MARWLEILGEFKFKIEHRSGSKHLNADALSRIPCTQCGDGVDSDENAKSEDLRLRARKILEQTKAFKRQAKTGMTDRRKNCPEKLAVNQTTQSIGDHTFGLIGIDLSFKTGSFIENLRKKNK